MRTIETFSPAEISAVTGASVKAVYKMIGERLPRGLSVQRDRQQNPTRLGAVCFVIDREMPKDVPLAVRRKLVRQHPGTDVRARQRATTGEMSYVVNVQVVADKVDQDLAHYRDAMRLIVADDAIQNGAATFRVDAYPRASDCRSASPRGRGDGAIRGLPAAYA